MADCTCHYTSPEACPIPYHKTEPPTDIEQALAEALEEWWPDVEAETGVSLDYAEGARLILATEPMQAFARDAVAGRAVRPHLALIASTLESRLREPRWEDEHQAPIREAIAAIIAAALGEEATDD